MAMSELRSYEEKYCEIEMLVGEIEPRKKVWFGSLGADLTNKRKCVKWQHVAAVNAASSESRSTSEVKKNWSDLKVNDRKRMALHRQSVSATGGGTGTPELSPFDEHMASIFGEASVAGAVAEKEGDTDMAEDETADEPGKQPKALCAVHQT